MTEKTTPHNAVEFGMIIGNRQTFGTLGSKCTAADAQCLKKTRDGQLYLGFAKNWDECCTRYFGMSRPNAERLIALFEEFGLPYFQVARLTRISAGTFRALAPHVHDEALHYNGEIVNLVPENSTRVAAIAATFRKPALKTPKAPIHALERRCDRLLADFEQLLREPQAPAARLLLEALLERTRSALSRFDLDLAA